MATRHRYAFGCALFCVAVLLTIGGCGDQMIVAEAPVVDPGVVDTTTPCPLDPTLVPTPEDLDGDGLSNLDEMEGYTVRVDSAGLGAELGQLDVYKVTSNPECADTDGDGLYDGVEFFYKTDPNKADTDGDGLTDSEEIRRWLTSPTSADTDGDATGPDGLSAPNPNLFDGNEVHRYGTSPTLADTDGDSKTDFEEVDHPLRSPLIAELPNVQVTFTGQVDVRLRVQYAESAGTESEYGKTFSTTTGNTSSTTDSTSTALTTAASAGGAGFFEQVVEGASSGGAKGAAMVLAGPVLDSARQGACDLGQGKKVDVGPVRFGLDDLGFVGDAVKTVGGLADDYLGVGATTDALCEPPSPQLTTTTSSALTRASSREAQEAYAEYLRESRTRTETTSGGSVSVGAIVRNTGLQTVEVGDLFVTMLQWQTSPDPAALLGAGAFRTLATLRPRNVDSLVLSPGETSQIIQFDAVDLNPAVVKGFLARPDSIVYAPASVELSDREGVNFKFLTEQTYARTASIIIDFGDGRIERHQVATNVRRNEDGTLAGITIGEVLNDILHIGFTMVEEERNVFGFQIPVNALAGIDGLYNVYGPRTADPTTGAPGAAQQFWVVYPSREEQAAPETPFDQIVIKHGDEFRIIYTQDLDGDGLNAREEALFGSSDSPDDFLNNLTWLPGPDGIPDAVDTDHDGLTDFFETKVGWLVIIEKEDAYGNKPTYRVFSDPTRADTDEDGVPDLIEGRDLGLDPNNPDTDDDGLSEFEDLDRRRPAGRMYVNVLASPGGDGLSWASAFNSLSVGLDTAFGRNIDADYTNDVSELWVAKGQYIPDSGATQKPFPLSNRLAVYGGFVGGETKRGQRNPDPLTNQTILLPNSSIGVILSCFGGAIDGFSVLNAIPNLAGAACSIGGNGSPTLRNMFFADNATRYDFRTQGGAVYVYGGKPTFESCTFARNRSGSGGAVFVAGTEATFVDCQFLDNVAGLDYGVNVEIEGGGGAIAWGYGALDSVALRLIRCRFVGNRAMPGYASPTVFDATTIRQRSGGALLVNTAAPGRAILHIEDCEFVDNEARENDGGAIALFGDRLDVSIVGSRFLRNKAAKGMAVATEDTRSTPKAVFTNQLLMTNCTIAESYRQRRVPEFGGYSGYLDAVLQLEGTVYDTIVNCIVAKSVDISNSPPVGIEDWVNVSGAFPAVRFCCLQLPGNSVYTDSTNFRYVDPRFVDLAAGDLRLDVSSVCIDAGSNFVDRDVATPGLQLWGLTDVDFARALRLVDGDGDGSRIIDMGAYEYQR